MTNLIKQSAEYSTLIHFQELYSNPYPGRGIIAGLDETGKYLIQVYWIMGRKENSRNRVFVEGAKGVLKTEFADPTKGGDPTNVIYTAMSSLHNKRFAVSNGHQTNDALQAAHWCTLILADTTFLDKWTFEHDEPNFTPRITSVFSKEESPLLQISILKKSPLDDSCTQHLHIYNNLQPGFGYCVTTYAENVPEGQPLPSFAGEPYLMPLEGSQEALLDSYWTALNEENKVSLAVKFINRETFDQKLLIKNKYEKVA